jgi:hypothetical protein
MCAFFHRRLADGKSRSSCGQAEMQISQPINCRPKPPFLFPWLIVFETSKQPHRSSNRPLFQPSDLEVDQLQCFKQARCSTEDATVHTSLRQVVSITRILARSCPKCYLLQHISSARCCYLLVLRLTLFGRGLGDRENSFCTPFWSGSLSLTEAEVSCCATRPATVGSGLDCQDEEDTAFRSQLLG